jgi:hypothetical protein
VNKKAAFGVILSGRRFFTSGPKSFFLKAAENSQKNCNSFA